MADKAKAKSSKLKLVEPNESQAKESNVPNNATKKVKNKDYEAELARLQELGCDLMQGEYFAGPLTAEAFETWMAGSAPDRRSTVAANPILAARPLELTE